MRSVNSSGVEFVAKSQSEPTKYIVKCPHCGKLSETWPSHYYRGSNPCKCRVYHERLYSIYSNMKTRCYNANSTGYVDYGARGISICQNWLNDYLVFQRWALSNGYADDLTIDRIDVDGDYSPDNCRWVDVNIQNNNKRNNIVIEFCGRKRTLKEICKMLNLNYKSEHSYYSRNGILAETERLKKMEVIK